MLGILISLNLDDIVNYYKNMDNFYYHGTMNIYKSNLSKVYPRNVEFFESRENTHYYGYTRDGSKFHIEYKNDSIYFYINDNLKHSEYSEIPFISPYKMFIYLYERNIPYSISYKKNYYEIVFNFEGHNINFRIDESYKIIFYKPLKIFEIIFY